jgi:membrane protein implicated in regulation of membrane protease activity
VVWFLDLFLLLIAARLPGGFIAILVAALLAAAGVALSLLLTLSFLAALILLSALRGIFAGLILRFIGTLIHVGHRETPALIDHPVQ